MITSGGGLSTGEHDDSMTRYVSRMTGAWAVGILAGMIRYIAEVDLSVSGSGVPSSDNEYQGTGQAEHQQNTHREDRKQPGGGGVRARLFWCSGVMYAGERVASRVYVCTPRRTTDRTSYRVRPRDPAPHHASRLSRVPQPLTRPGGCGRMTHDDDAHPDRPTAPWENLPQAP